MRTTQLGLIILSHLLQCIKQCLTLEMLTECIISDHRTVAFTIQCSHLPEFDDEVIEQGSATYGPRAGSGPPSKTIRPAAPFTNCSDCMSLLVVLYFMNLLSSQQLVLHSYEELLIRNRAVV